MKQIATIIMQAYMIALQAGCSYAAKTLNREINKFKKINNIK